jgi:hypothetical protein
MAAKVRLEGAVKLEFEVRYGLEHDLVITVHAVPAAGKGVVLVGQADISWLPHGPTFQFICERIEFLVKKKIKNAILLKNVGEYREIKDAIEQNELLRLINDAYRWREREAVEEVLQKNLFPLSREGMERFIEFKWKEKAESMAESMRVKDWVELRAWKDLFEDACSALRRVLETAYKYRVEFDTEVEGSECKLVIYRESDGKVHIKITKDVYEKALQFLESEDKALSLPAQAFLDYMKKFSELFEVYKVKSFLQMLKNEAESAWLEDGKIVATVKGIEYKIDEAKVKELARVNKDIQKYYEQIFQMR